MTLTTSLNATAFDRYLTVHVAANATPIKVTLDRGTGTFKKLVDGVYVPANECRDFGPYFLPNGHSLRGGADSANGDWSIDEMRP